VQEEPANAQAKMWGSLEQEQEDYGRLINNNIRYSNGTDLLME